MPRLTAPNTNQKVHARRCSSILIASGSVLGIIGYCAFIVGGIGQAFRTWCPSVGPCTSGGSAGGAGVIVTTAVAILVLGGLGAAIGLYWRALLGDTNKDRRNGVILVTVVVVLVALVALHTLNGNSN